MTAVARPAPAELFAGSQTRLAVVGNAVGSACILANWWLLADTSDLAANLSSAGLAIAGVGIAGLTNALWLLTARGSIARRRHRLSTRVAAWAAPLDGPARPVCVPASVATPARASGPAGFIAVDGATLYHRPDCPLVSRKRTAAVAVETHRANSLRLCGVCEPAPAVDHDGARQ